MNSNFERTVRRNEKPELTEKNKEWTLYLYSAAHRSIKRVHTEHDRTDLGVEMGTNFYLLIDLCPHCGRSDERIHIGKSSSGWCFALHVDPEQGINGLEDWKKRWTSGKIVDEYGKDVSADDMLLRITDRSHPVDWKDKKWTSTGYLSEERFHQENNSVRGPNNLLRRKIDGRFCIGHGEGTWDLVVGEFG